MRTSKSQEQKLQALYRQGDSDIFKNLADTLPVAIYQCQLDANEELRLLYISNAIKNLTGLRAKTIKNDINTFFVKVIPEDYDKFIKSHVQAFKDKNHFHQEIRFKRNSKETRWLSIKSSPFFMPDNSLVYQGYIEDITESKEAEVRVRRSEALLDQIFNTANVAIFLVNSKGIITRINNKMTEMFACPNERIVNHPYVNLIAPHERAVGHQKMLELLASDIDAVDHERLYRRKDGTSFWGNLTGRRFDFGEGKAQGLIGVIMDVNARKKAEDEVRKLAFYDTLTNLPNRRLLLEHIQKSINRSERYNTHNALIFIDLDNFKTLNDTKGHDIGDLLLTETAKRLQATIRKSDTVARFGGDEFIVLLNNLDSSLEEATKKANQVAYKIIEEVRRPFKLKDHKVNSSTSLGITMFKGAEYSIEELLKHADLAMYQAKASGRNTLSMFEHDKD